MRTCLLKGNALGAWGTWVTSEPYGILAVCIVGNGTPAYLGLKAYGILGIGTLMRGGGMCGFILCLKGRGTMIVTPDWRASVAGSGGPLAFGTVPGVDGSDSSNKGLCTCCLWEYKSPWLTVQFPGGGSRFGVIS